MREILFRGKRIDNGEWVEGAFLNDRDGAFYICPAAVDISISYGDNGNRRRIGCWYNVDPSTVGQYTGLTDKNDKNGKRIFEGDVVRVKHGYCGNPEHPTQELVEAVKYSPKSCCYEFYRWSGDIYEVEVIGNIHDNPELLEV